MSFAPSNFWTSWWIFMKISVNFTPVENTSSQNFAVEMGTLAAELQTQREGCFQKKIFYQLQISWQLDVGVQTDINKCKIENWIERSNTEQSGRRLVRRRKSALDSSVIRRRTGRRRKRRMSCLTATVVIQISRLQPPIFVFILVHEKCVVLTQSGKTMCIVPSYFRCRKQRRRQTQRGDASYVLNRQTCPSEGSHLEHLA